MLFVVLKVKGIIFDIFNENNSFKRAKLQAEISSLTDKMHTLEQQKSDNDGKNNVKVAELSREFREKENDLMAQVTIPFLLHLKYLPPYSSEKCKKN